MHRKDLCPARVRRCPSLLPCTGYVLLCNPMLRACVNFDNPNSSKVQGLQQVYYISPMTLPGMTQLLHGVGPAASLAGSLGNGGRSADSLVLMLEVLPNMLIMTEAAAPLLNADAMPMPDQESASQRKLLLSRGMVGQDRVTLGSRTVFYRRGCTTVVSMCVHVCNCVGGE